MEKLQDIPNEQKERLLETLLLSEDFEELNNLTNNFNIFNTLKLQNNEVKHSNFLAWLMAPYENHGLGEYFLKEFLKSSLNNFSLCKETELKLNEIAFMDLSDAAVKREENHIDILIESKNNNLVCLIENKIWSGENNDQLKRYADILQNDYKNYKKLYIYLTPYEDNAELIPRNTEFKATAYYIPVNYGQIIDILNKILRFKANCMNEDVKIFICHYKEMIERDIMGNTDEHIAELCKKIYREHRQAIDLINDNNDERTDIFNHFLKVLNNRKDVDILKITKNRVRFLPNNITDRNKLNFGVDNQPIVFLHVLFYGKKPLYIEVVVDKADESNGLNIEKREKLKKFLISKMNLARFNGGKGWAYSPYKAVIEFDKYRELDEQGKSIENYLSDQLNKIDYINKLRDAINEWNY